jgi:hypothetical protein
MGYRVRALGRCSIALAAAGCAHQVDGRAVPAPGRPPGPPGAVVVEELMLDVSRMRGITGGGDDLTPIPTTDRDYPLDIGLLADGMPSECRFMFAETATFGTDTADFHKTSYQEQPIGALISQAVAAYRDPAAARRALDALSATAGRCTRSPVGRVYVGNVATDADSLRIRPGNGCGRDYRVKSVVLAEVTFCAYPDSVPELVITNLLTKAPG